MDNAMERRRVLLLWGHPLLSEGLENILGKVEDVELMGPWALDSFTLAQLSDEVPDIVLIAEQEDEHEAVAVLTTQLLERYPDLPVIHVGLSQNIVRVHTSRTLPARSTDLIEIIRSLPTRQSGNQT
jgi:DNA-binding NarL/FixJ family response regulator